MSKTTIIVAAVKADLPLIKNLLQELMETMEDKEGFNIEHSFLNLEELMKEPSNHLLVAKENNQIVGFVNFTTRKSIMHSGPSGLIDELIVSRKNRGSGIGKQLILSVIQKCKGLGCSEVEVSTEKSNSSSRKFYKSCGFEENAVLLEIDL